MSVKKLLIVNNDLRIGGVQRALVDLLRCIHDRYDITLALFDPSGALMDLFPGDVKILPVRSAYRFLGMSGKDVKGRPLLWLGRNFFAAVTRLFGRPAAVGLMALGQKKITGFDVAVSYLHDAGERAFYGGCNDFVLRHTDAPKKIAFLHCDYVRCGADNAHNSSNYEQFDMIAACSNGCRASFLKVLPESAKKTVVVSNCQDYNGICRRVSENMVSLPCDRINILTVARFGKEKGVERAVEALAALSDRVAAYHYYVIGDGIRRPLIEEKIKALALEERVTLLGELAVPYGYMKAADLLLIPSVSEAAPLVIGEAACLGTPVLSTETSSAVEMIADTGFGWVCGNSVEGLAQKLTELLEDPIQLHDRSQALSALHMDNEKAVAQFAALIG